MVECLLIHTVRRPCKSQSQSGPIVWSGKRIVEPKLVMSIDTVRMNKETMEKALQFLTNLFVDAYYLTTEMYTFLSPELSQS